MWHGAGVNFSDEIRYMFKIRLQPTEKQELLWDPESKYKPLPNRALYWTDENQESTINDILMKSYPLTLDFFWSVNQVLMCLLYE